MLSSVFGIKKSISQRFTKDGRRVPVTVVGVSPMTVTQLKNPDLDGYWAVQVGIGERSIKHTTKPIQGHIRGTLSAPRFLREVKLEEAPEGLKAGEKVMVETVLAPGDLVDVVGVSKGKGFAGGVKRHHFEGGPRTHGQSDRERAPGSIGSSTTPGRVYKGKRMAGHLGNSRVTVRNLTVLVVAASGEVALKGVVPSFTGGLLQITKTGKKAKRFEPLLDRAEALDKEAIAREQEEMAKGVGAVEKGSKTAEAIKKALEAQKPAEAISRRL